MTDFNFISANETRKALFYQLPKVLFESDKYMKMSNDSKIAYAMLKDRCEYSLQNDWVDQNGNIYFIFTTAELMDLLHVGNNKVATIKKELASYGLLLSKRMPPKTLPDGSKKGVPARLYLGQLDLTATDVYTEKKSSEDARYSESGEITLLEKHDNIKEISQSVINTSWGNSASNKHFSESGEITHNLYKTISLDTNRHIIDSEKDELQDKLLLENFVEINSNSQRVNATFVPDNVLKLIQTFSPSYSVAQITVKTIHNAKNKAEQIAGIKMAYEEMDDYIANPDQGLYNTVLRAYQKQKTEEVKDIQNVIFTYVKNWFVEYPIQAKKATQDSENLPNVSLHNWMD
ncbi:replication initiator protein A [Enterococcus gilvus]|uniref:Replication initiator A N-terminal domain-containing protein n=1 Tax=Enterococcus gilvus ATCC BAA-350 TaxID=1158614 RepID=R2X9I1_9ENTE|nr:replication initiator protein A [Enterococcus gilvus]EOI51459.1 hypothetical protein UKC_04134 [Enterococcus gilvus ATCC BAA-350]EOW77230.1 hypothetical protein I592_04206 [Enterococcus gilvus ATCC BAA-350]OJG41113.1 hypothetical protein RV02_GL001200 [Enterococcus gilvus]